MLAITNLADGRIGVGIALAVEKGHLVAAFAEQTFVPFRIGAGDLVFPPGNSNRIVTQSKTHLSYGPIFRRMRHTVVCETPISAAISVWNTPAAPFQMRQSPLLSKRPVLWRVSIVWIIRRPFRRSGRICRVSRGKTRSPRP